MTTNFRDMKKDTETRQKEIIEISLDILTQGGCNKLTMKQIAKNVGISEQAIYRHFENKVAILAAIIEYFRSRVSKIFMRAKEAGSPLQQIQQFIETLLEHFEDHPGLAVVVTSEDIFQNESSLNEKIKILLEDRISNVTEIIQNGQDAGEITDKYPARDLAFMILGALRFLVINWRLSSFSFSLSKKGKSLEKSYIDLIKMG
jgi:TetR/AcrR family transcriptional regulator, fatty acid metabolism regulator protein